MKQILAFLVLLSHLNFMMFIPHLDEEDIYDSQGHQVQDINAVTDLLTDLLPDTPQNTTGDQDDDTAIYVHSAKTDDYIIEQQTLNLELPACCRTARLFYKPYAERGHAQPLLDIPSPPPDHAT